ncbi:MAG: chromate resistance protein, partial [Sulfuricaulis sp.]|nr:chromate resistance protein [Sulfuricaulis sp.]
MLVISLPGRRATPRMRIWRALKGLGAVVLRDGVYLLPHSESAARSLREQAEAVMASGGDAHVLTFTSTEPQQAEHFRKLFDRTADYAQLIEAIRKHKSGLTKKRAESVSRHLKKIRREFEAVAATDHFA